MKFEAFKRLSAEQGVLRYRDEQGYLRIAALGSVREELLAVCEAAREVRTFASQAAWEQLDAALAALDAALEKQEGQG